LVGGELGVDVGVVVFESGVDEGAEAGTQGVVVNEEVSRLGRMDEALRFRVVGDGGHDAVDVGVVSGAAVPGMEDGGEAGLEVLVFEFGAGDVGEGLGGGLEEEIVEDLGLVKAQGAEFLGNGEGDEEVRDV
jgi:hypothetical protein